MAGSNHEKLGEIPDFFRGRGVLLTGATGFIGKAILEKLLRCCPDVESIFVLVRPKKGVEPEHRLRQILALPLYADLPVERVRAVAGDITLPCLGLSPEDLDAVVTAVSVVLHSAATLSFQEPMRHAVQLNLQATAHVLQLARRIPSLAALVHVSTAYSNCDRFEIREEVYPAPASVHEILRRAAEEDEKELERDSPRLLGRRPNTYTFTKALAENLVLEEAADLPVAIVRPSIVGWAWRDPSPGWVASYNGVVGPFAAISQGVLRSVNCEPSCVADLVPVDVVVNTVLAVAWRTAQRPPAAVLVYNCVTGARNPIRWGELLAAWLVGARARPSRSALWYPGCTFTPSLRGHRLRVAALMLLPAYLHDLLAPLLGRADTMMQLQRRQLRLLDSLAFFSTQEWRFQDDNMQHLSSLLSPRDRFVFPVDVAAVDWEAYLGSAVVGTKRHLYKEQPSLQRPRTSTGLYLLHRLAQLALLSGLCLLLGWLAQLPQVAQLRERVWPNRLISFIRFLLSRN